MPTQEETPASTPAVETTTQAAPAEVAPADVAPTTPDPTPPVDLEDLEWDGEADLSSLPHAQKFPKFFSSLKSRVEQLRAKKEEDDLLEKFLSEGDPAVKRELEELRAFRVKVESDQKAAAFEEELRAKLPPEIFENDEALEMYLNRVHDKGLDEDEALVLVQAKFSGKPKAEVEAEVKAKAEAEEVEEVEESAEPEADDEAPAPAPAQPRTTKAPPPSVLAAKKPASAPPTRRGFDSVDDVWKHYGL